MRAHHRRAIDALAAHFAEDETCLGVIVGGSIAKGLQRDDSDVDVMLLVTDELYRERWERDQLFYWSTAFCDYPGGYIDGKYVNMAFLRAAAERGNEVTRAAFKNAFVAHAKVEGLDDLVRSICVFREDEKAEKIRSFYAQFEVAAWYATEAAKRDDRYLLLHSVSEMALYGARLILEHNGILYPYHKHLLTELERAEDKPASMMEAMEALLETPDAATARAFYDIVKGFRNWNEAGDAWPVRYHKDTELAWMDRRAYIGDL